MLSQYSFDPRSPREVVKGDYYRVSPPKSGDRRFSQKLSAGIQYSGHSRCQQQRLLHGEVLVEGNGNGPPATHRLSQFGEVARESLPLGPIHLVQTGFVWACFTHEIHLQGGRLEWPDRSRPTGSQHFQSAVRARLGLERRRENGG